jgi:hypothetical protein
MTSSKPGLTQCASGWDSYLGRAVLALAAGLRLLPFQRGKERLIRRIPVERLANSGCFRNRILRGSHGILWDGTTLPDIISRSMLWNGSYQDDVLACLKLATRPGDVVFDVGAHFGLMSIYASKLVGPDGKVVAFEPSPRNREVLVRHCRLNRNN